MWIPRRERLLISSAVREAAGLPERIQEPLPPSDSFTGYVIRREIHRGAQGVVYQAVQKSTQRRVAIKVMREGPFAHPHERARFEREVRILGQLQHPNIVTIHDSGQADGHFYYVMDYIAGEALDAWASRERCSVDAVLHLFVEICDAVSAAHVRGVIHRDLKPGNIVIDGAGHPRVLDFGLAKIAGSAMTESATPQPMTLAGQFLGSLPWASPEQAAGAPDRIDVRTDVYALGVILYQMLTARFPYGVVGPMRTVLNNITNALPTPPRKFRRGINGEVETILLRCLQKEPGRRYQSASELAQDIRHYLNGEPIEARRDSTLYVVKKALWRHRVVSIALMIIAATSVTFGWISHRQLRAAEVQRLMAEGNRDELSDAWHLAYNRYQQVLSLDPHQPRALFYAARALKKLYFKGHAQLNQIEKALSLCNKAVMFDPKAHQLWNLKCELEYSLHNLPAAEAACRQSLALKPDYFYASSNLAKVLAWQHRLDEAMDIAQAGVEQAKLQPQKGSNDDGILRTYGTLQMHFGNAGAIDSFAAAVNINGKDYRNWLLLARAHLLLPEKLDYQQALSDAEFAERATELHDPRFKRILSQALLYNNDFARAKDWAHAALKDGDLPTACHLIQAIAFAELGQVDIARGYLQWADEASPAEFEDGGGLVVTAEKGFLWIDTQAELLSLREWAAELIDSEK